MKHKVLIIENEKDVQVPIKEALEMEGYEGFLVENEKESIQKAIEIKPDLMISDIEMPFKDGFELIEELKSCPQLSTVPFIFLSTRTKNADTYLNTKKSANVYISKSFTKEELLALVKKHLHRYKNVNKIKNTKSNKSEKEKVDIIKLQLASSIPHEFKTPLNGIIASAQLLSESDCTLLEENKELIDIILKSAFRLDELVNKFLYYNKLELTKSYANDSNSEKLCVNAQKLIKSKALLIAKNHKRKNDLKFRLENVNLNIIPNELSNLVRELVSNAFKFSSSGSKVTLEGKADKEHYLLIICDEGKGFLPQQLDDVEAFTQFERNLYEQQGVGLGLMIVKKICEINDFKCTVDSDGNSYTKFFIEIPIHKYLE